jgi:hypothetical protein
MLITEQLIFIHYPKAGGTFVTRGWKASSLAFLHDEPRICPMEAGCRTTRDWKSLYGDELLAMVK